MKSRHFAVIAKEHFFAPWKVWVCRIYDEEGFSVTINTSSSRKSIEKWAIKTIKKIEAPAKHNELLALDYDSDTLVAAGKATPRED